jgi:dihydroxy-acid dehydratase
MMYRNFLAMGDGKSSFDSQPIDGAVFDGWLLTKRRQDLLMGAISMNLPAIYLPAGPMLRGNWNGKESWEAAATFWKYWAEKKAGNITDCEWNEMEDGIARSPGHCMTMGTASTMTGDRRNTWLNIAGRFFDSGRRCKPLPNGNSLWATDC